MSYSNGNTDSHKRKATHSPSTPKKKAKRDSSRYKDSAQEEEYGIIDRQFYPPEMTNERCKQYISNEVERPLDTLSRAQAETRSQRDQMPVKEAVVHWFKCDLRLLDNKALHLASEKAKSKGVPLICIHVISPQDYKAHMTSAVRVDFALRTLEVLKADLEELDIPLYVETVEKRKAIPNRIFELCDKWGASHVYTNIEYEVDELRREASITREGAERGIAVEAVPDTCVVAPGELSTGAGKQYAVYSPWFRAWISYLHSHPRQLKLFDPPGKNPSVARSAFKDLFNNQIPEAPENRTLTVDEQKRYRSLWPAGEHEARGRLNKFLKDKVEKYKDTRNFPAANSTAMVSVHLSCGTLSARTAVATARDHNSAQKLDAGNKGIIGWISEIGWRDFYKHVLAHWPYVCMNKPFKPEYTDIKWEYNNDLFQKWANGQTGYPFIDAAMRQLNYIGYMHNRARMAVASFLAKDLLIDWRMGERYFMEHLIDGDFASNNGGWGFSASTGVDPQPYFRIFNPILQGEKFDEEGEYIRKWVPELAHVKGKAIHDPYGRGAKGVQGYPKMCVDHKESRGRALARYKEGLGRDTA
ncbi:DNA photolyase phr1 [Lecanora helva]